MRQVPAANEHSSRNIHFLSITPTVARVKTSKKNVFNLSKWFVSNIFTTGWQRKTTYFIAKKIIENYEGQFNWQRELITFCALTIFQSGRNECFKDLALKKLYTKMSAIRIF